MENFFSDSYFKKPFISYLSYFVLCSVSFAIGYVFLVHQQHSMPLIGENKGDAGQYISISHYLFQGMSDGVRTLKDPHEI